MPAEVVVTAPAIYIQNISLSYQGVPVFTDINLNLRVGKWTALLGASGVGKSSLLRMVAGLVTAEETSSGTIIDGDGNAIKNQIAWMAQTDMLLPWLTTLDNLLLGIRLRGHLLGSTLRQDGTMRAATIKAQALLSQANLTHATNLYPHQLSGGMRQRIALLRTFMENKPIVLMDEPFSALDTMTRYQLHALAIELLRDKTVLFVTHDPTEALRLADDIYLLTSDDLQLLGRLTSPTPRTPSEPELVQLQADIYANLMRIAKVAA
jgi:putative hydroxymethylpyrimidine transport system ATP-binding protein